MSQMLQRKFAIWLVTTATIVGSSSRGYAAVWQWRVDVPGEKVQPDTNPPQAFLWIPEDCHNVRGVVLANHNMLEKPIFEHPTMRQLMSELGFAQVLVVPVLDQAFDPSGSAPDRFEQIMTDLASASGYSELAEAPVVTLGHSASATWPWNFAAALPKRTLAIVSLKGDSPQTNLTGYGRINPDWGDRGIAGIPALMVMGEYEWWEDRLTPIFSFKAKHPDVPISLLGDVGRGHFDASDRLVHLLAMFIRKAAAHRLPHDHHDSLRPVRPEYGWLVDRYRRHEASLASPAPFGEYAGNRYTAFWAFDREMAEAIDAHHQSQIGRFPQLLGVIQDGKVLPQLPTHAQVHATFTPETDGPTVSVEGSFLSAVPTSHGDNLTKWADRPVGSELGHGDLAKIRFSTIMGPVEQIGDKTFRYRLGPTEWPTDRRNGEIWLLALHPGSDQYQSAVQQILVTIPANVAGREQAIEFKPLPDVPETTKSLQLHAISNADLPVNYYILSGPAEIEGSVLQFTTVPPRAKFPIPITVVAWQWGLPDHEGNLCPVQTANPVARTFYLTSDTAEKDAE